MRASEKMVTKRTITKHKRIPRDYHPQVPILVLKKLVTGL